MFLVWAPLRGRAFLRFLGWGGVGGCNNVHVSCVQGEATWMLRRCYVDHTLLLRWGDVDATVGVGWGAVGWGGAITFMYLACKVMRRGCCADVTLIIRWCYVEEMLMLLLGWGGVGWGGRPLPQRHVQMSGRPLPQKRLKQRRRQRRRKSVKLSFPSWWLSSHKNH